MCLAVHTQIRPSDLCAAARQQHTIVPNGQNPPKISSLDVISRIFPNKLEQINLISLSGHDMHFIFKICQTVAASQFHEFYESHFWRIFCYLAQTPGYIATAKVYTMPPWWPELMRVRKFFPDKIAVCSYLLLSVTTTNSWCTDATPK